MKISKLQLRQIIQEELNITLAEGEVTMQQTPEQAKKVALSLLNDPDVKKFKEDMEAISRSGGKRKAAVENYVKSTEGYRAPAVGKFISAMRIAVPVWFEK